MHNGVAGLCERAIWRSPCAIPISVRLNERDTMLRVLLLLLLLLVLAGGVGLTVRYWAWLDARHLAGVAVVGLCFFAVAILGIHLQLAEDLPEGTEPAEVVRRFARYTSQVVVFLLVFLSGIAAIVVGVKQVLAAVLPDWLTGIVYFAAFLGYIAGVIRVLLWLSERGVIGR